MNIMWMIGLVIKLSSVSEIDWLLSSPMAEVQP